jgi:soluble lytic murein transglycosylase-like protein
MRKIAVLLLAVLLITTSMDATAKSKETWVSDEIYAACVEIGEIYDICPELLVAIIERESSCRQYAENGSCKGLMQVSTRWHKDRMERLGVSDIYDIYGNILVGTDYLAELFEKYGDLYLVLMCYNMGESRALELWKDGFFSKYAVSISERSIFLQDLRWEDGLYD